MNQFQSWIARQIEASGGSLRKAADKAGVSHVTLKKAQDGGKLDLDTLQALADWRGVSLTYIVNLYLGRPMGEDEQLQNQVAMLLQENEQMRGIFDLMLSPESQMTEADMAEIMMLIELKMRRAAASA